MTRANGFHLSSMRTIVLVQVYVCCTQAVCVFESVLLSWNLQLFCPFARMCAAQSLRSIECTSLMWHQHGSFACGRKQRLCFCQDWYHCVTATMQHPMDMRRHALG